MTWADEYRCVACAKSFAWPWGYRNAYYLLPSGETFALKSQLGWCGECDRPSYFETFSDDLELRLETLNQLRQGELAATQSRTWGVVYQWLYRRKITKANAMADAYSRLVSQEQRRLQYWAGRTRPRCFCCENEAADDAFVPFEPSKCRSCGGELEKPSESNHFSFSRQPTYYDESGRKADDDYIQQHPPLQDDEVLAKARRVFEYECSKHELRASGLW
ncbi:MAG: hypothetical protein ACRC01_00535 [Deefgea sp.]